eukprot:TRINITY_DN4489_c0_g1_i8.p1 TRINITY_DN4489_c0_g1~~TRINITY_DN4489_c0_g1_i8.p1  ORF type:complete len:339 (+),score=75.31 TRINITY_DN4489_c0_g1_i8:103-1119(+)
MSTASLNQIMIEGSVLKRKSKGKKHTPWKNRWLTLYADGSLRYFNAPRPKGGKTKGVIDLVDCLHIQESTVKEFSVELVMSVPKEVIFLFCFESDWLKASWMTALKDCLQETRERFSDSRWTSAEKSKTLAQQLHESWKMTSASKSGHVLVLFQLPEAGIPEPHSWAIRFVVLSEHHLVCFKNKGAADGSPEEKIALDASCVAVQDSSLGKSFACRITLDSGVRMALAFDSRPIMEGWIEAITRRSAQFTRKDSSSSASNSVGFRGEQSIYTVVATEDFTSCDKPNPLQYKKDDIITVLEFADDGWHRGQIGESCGVFDSTKTVRFVCRYDDSTYFLS